MTLKYSTNKTRNTVANTIKTFLDACTNATTNTVASATTENTQKAKKMRRMNQLQNTVPIQPQIHANTPENVVLPCVHY